MSRNDAYVFGLDIGTRSVVGTVGYKQDQNGFTVIAQEIRNHETRAMMDGQIHDIGKVAETVKQVKKSLERQLGSVKLSDVCIAAAGRVLKTVTVRVDEQFPEETVISEEKIRELELKGVEKAYSVIRDNKKEEDVNYYCVAYTIVKYYLNDFPISNLSEQRANRIGADVLATFLPNEVIEGLYTTVEKAGLKVNNLTLEPIAAILVAIPEKYRMLNIALVDVGAGTSDISVTKDGSIIAYGMIPMAGDALTEVIAADHLVEFNVAEEIKLASGTKKKTIVYNDIMGLKQKTTPAEVISEVKNKIDEITSAIAGKILELNGGKTVSAVFIVGGGGKITGFTESLAKALRLPKERVALRGEEVLTFVDFKNTEVRKDPTLVTPIGICLNYYENRNNFVFVTLNGESVKLYDNNKLTVTDAAIAAGIPNEALFPKRGTALEFVLNGQARMVRGEAGEAAVVTVNGKEASVNTPIEPNDDIKIIESTTGRPGHLEVAKLPEYKNEICFTVNDKSIICPKFMVANGVFVSGFYDIKKGDVLENLNYYSLEQVLEFLDIPYRDGMMVNNEIADRNTKVYDNFKVTTEVTKTTVVSEQPADEKKGPEPEKAVESVSKNESAAGRITVRLNGDPLTLNGKDEFRFVDVLDHSTFNLQNPEGSSVHMTVNGAEAAFIDVIRDGDEIELWWNK